MMMFDPISASRIKEVIDELQHEFPIVIVTDNMQRLARLCDHPCLNESGRDDGVWPTDELFVKPGKQATDDYITGRFGCALIERTALPRSPAADPCSGGSRIGIVTGMPDIID